MSMAQMTVAMRYNFIPFIMVADDALPFPYLAIPDTLTGVTQWERPGEDAFVIPLGLIQVGACDSTLVAIVVAAEVGP